MLIINTSAALMVRQFVLQVFLLFISINICQASGSLVYSIDFSKQPEGDARPWLEKKGYLLKLEASEIDITFSNNQLNLETKEEKIAIFALKLAPENYLKNITSIDIEWGVTRQLVGADWENGNNRVPIALMFFFGTEEISSGLPFGINSAPYFLSPFIGHKEVPGKVYTGKLYKKGGRYLCVAVSDGSSKIIKSTIKIDPRYMKLFNKRKIPPLTAIAFQMNTEDTKGGASVFIRKLNFYTD
ncbi:MAG: hypothetical protein DRQ62_08650 [Gammaproteobacteria bacterium]|nr:MAG: hypothetical protein DRQ62_08650 [Gammaproteobacteria bacterium]